MDGGVNVCGGLCDIVRVVCDRLAVMMTMFWWSDYDDNV